MAQGSSTSHADVRVYQGVHNVFRLVTTRFADATEKLEPSALQNMIGSHWDFYTAVLHHSAVRAFEAQPDATRQAAMHDGVVAVRDLFFPHLDIEDEQIIPAIAESIPPKEWERLDKAALKSIPREHLPIAVGALDEFIQGLPEDERPPPPPPPIRIMLALSWRKKWSNWVKPLLV